MTLASECFSKPLWFSVFISHTLLSNPHNSPMRRALPSAPLTDEKTKAQEDTCPHYNTYLRALEQVLLKALCCLGWSHGPHSPLKPPLQASWRTVCYVLGLL